ncbi:hypothetical protein AAVH_22504 [Aphelenchoides avenae]|nr:hypothetical protein AAVH_22504 [Aphelenchus avenae]
MRCDIDADGSWKTSVVACLTPDSHERFHVNTVASDLSGSWCCKRKADGSVAMFPARPGLCRGEPERPPTTAKPTTAAPPPEPIEESIEEDEPIFPFPDDDSLEDTVAEEPTEPPYVPPPHTPPTFDYKSHHEQNNGAYASKIGSLLVVTCLFMLPYAF